MSLCPICNKDYKSLRSHLMRTHKLTREYIDNAYSDLELVSEETHISRSNGASSGHMNRTNYKCHKKRVYSQEYCRKRSEIMKERWSDSEIRKKYTEACQISHKTDEFRRKMSIEISKPSHQEALNKSKSTENYHINLSNSMKSSYKRNPERSRKVSESNIRRYKLRDQTPYDRFVHPSKNVGRYFYNGISFRSRWEVYVARTLDDLNTPWEYEALNFQYFNSGISHTYIPDFFISIYNLVIEVKPSEFINEEIVQLKALSVQATSNYKFMFITEKELCHLHSFLEEKFIDYRKDNQISENNESDE